MLKGSTNYGNLRAGVGALGGNLAVSVEGILLL
jgi:hypothetical protein